jgi:hypothetical protein
MFDIMDTLVYGKSAYALIAQSIVMEIRQTNKRYLTDG